MTVFLMLIVALTCAQGAEKGRTKEKFLQIYEKGKWRRAPVSELEQSEGDRRKAGLQPWRELILDAAQILTGDLCGIKDGKDAANWLCDYTPRSIVMTKNGHKVSYTLQRQKRNVATVLLVTPTDRYRLILQRPCEREWYVTAVERIDPTRTEGT